MQNFGDYQALISALLKESSWRERVVEEFVFGAGEHVRVSATFQFGLAGELLRDHKIVVGSENQTRLLLPITSRDKRPLLNFDLRGPEGRDCFLLPRDQIGVLQAGYLREVFTDGGLVDGIDPETEDLLEAVCTFTPALFRSILAEHAGNQDLALATYLTGGLSSDKAITTTEIRHWRQRTAQVKRTLVEALEEPANDCSSAEEILLAIPHMLRPPRNTSEITDLVDRFGTIVEALDRQEATGALRALAESGRRWIVIVELDVPIGERFAVKLSEDRPLDLQGKRLSRQRFALGDANRAHLEIRLDDPNVHLGAKPICRDPLGNEVGIGPLEAARFTDEAASYYSSVTDRPRFLDVDIDLQLGSGLRVMPGLVGVLGVAATVICLLLPAGPDLVTGLAVMAVPITVAAALLAVREQTALASRLQTQPRAIIVIVTMLLWTAVLLRLLWGGIALPPWHDSSRSARQTCVIILERSRRSIWLRTDPPAAGASAQSKAEVRSAMQKPVCG